MNKGIVYLAGPIANTETGEAFGWRAYAQVRLREEGFMVLNPLREKSELRFTAIGNDFTAYEKLGVFYTPRAILTRDYNDVKRADILLVNLLGAKTISAGTAMELAWAHAFQTPTVVMIEADGSNPHDKHPMIHQAIGFRETTLAAAIDTVHTVMR